MLPDLSPWEVPAPLLFNTWKHHAGFLREEIRNVGAAGPDALRELAARLCVIGADLMDLYYGPLTPREIGRLVIARLAADGVLEPAAFREWIAAAGGFRTLDLNGDLSRWVLRLGAEESRYVHLHPGRWAPLTCRARANVLKTAVMALAYAAVHGGNLADLELINRVRSALLNLPPLARALRDEHGSGAMIALLGKHASPLSMDRQGLDASADARTLSDPDAGEAES
jgi:hypothetical protein